MILCLATLAELLSCDRWMDRQTDTRPQHMLC